MTIRVDDRQMAWRPGMTLLDVISELKEGDMIAVVRLDGRLVSRPAFGTTPVRDGAQVQPIPLVAGG